MKIEKHLEDISEIRSMMEQSSKFLSLGGISGVVVGLVGLATAAVVKWYLDSENAPIFDPKFKLQQPEVQLVLILIACGSLILALGLSLFFSTRIAKKTGQPIWTSSAKYLLLHLFIPLLTGGVFCIALLNYHIIYLIVPSLLIFYGLALFTAGKFTLNEIRNLGCAEIVVGLLAAFWVDSGLYFWAFGFGVLHILNGVLMYFRYEK